jgi:WD40 repeat protein
LSARQRPDDRPLPRGGPERRWALLAAVLGAVTIASGAATQLIDPQGGQRRLWVGLVVIGAMVAITAAVLQSSWWNARQQGRAARAYRDRRERAEERSSDATARGVARPDWDGSYFTGRTAAISALVEFLDRPWGSAAGPVQRVRVVVGGPGSGKSAVLGRLAVLADPAARPDPTARPNPPGRHAVTPAPGSVDRPVNARGRDARQVLGAVAERAGLGDVWHQPDGQEPPTVDDLVLALRGRRPPATVIIDGLDEAVDPDRVVREVIRPILDSGPTVGLRLLLGARPNLVRSLGVPEAAIIDLDEDAYFEPTDLVEYTLKCLMLLGEPKVRSPYEMDVRHARRVAVAVAARAGRTFLIAQLTARALAHEASIIDLDAVTDRPGFPDNVGAAMDAQLARFADAARVRDLLVPLAFAEGDGLPPGRVWATLASALGTAAYTDHDVRSLLASPTAADLIRRAGADNHLRYRLFHEALGEHLRRWSANPAPFAAITAALLETMPRSAAGGRDWRTAHPYLRAHLATHAARSGDLDELLTDPGFLLAAEPDGLLRVLTTTRDPQSRRTAAVYRGIVHQLRGSARGDAASLLELHARQQGHDALADRVATADADRSWAAPWVRARPVHPHQVLGRHAGEVNALALAEVDGRLRAVSGDSTGALGIWDVERGTPVDDPLRVTTGEVVAVTVAETPATGPVIVIGCDDGLWTLRLADRRLRRIADTRVRSIAALAATAAPVVIVGDIDGRIGVIDLNTGAALLPPFAAHRGPVEVVATVVADGRTVAISAGFDGGIAVWDVSDGSPVGQLMPAVVDPVAIRAEPAGTGTAVAVVGIDGVIGGWDVGTGQPVFRRLLGYRGQLGCLAVTTLGAGPAVVGGALDGRVLVWSAADDRAVPDDSRIDEPDAAMAGHEGWVSSVTVARGPDRDIVVTGGFDGTVRSWNVADADLFTDPDDAHDGELTGLALLPDAGDDSVVISGGIDGTVRRYRVADGKPAADPIAAHEHGVRAVCAGTVDGAATVVSGGLDGTVRVWAAQTGRPVGDPVQAHQQVVRALALAEAGGRPVLVSGGDDGVRRWDPRTGGPLGADLAPGEDIRALTIAVVRGTPILVAGGDRGVHRWHLATGEPIGPPLATGDRFEAVAIGTVDAAPVVFAGGDGTGLRGWNLLTGAAVTTPRVTGRVVRSLAVTTVPGRPVLVAGDDDGFTWFAGGRTLRVRLGFGVTSVLVAAPGTILAGSRRGLYHITLANGA